MALAEPAHRAAGLLQDQDYVRILCHADGDGLASAGLLLRALQREGVDFHVTAERELSPRVVRDLSAEEQECVVLLDLPPEGLDLSEVASHVIVVDHHPVDGSRSSRSRRTTGGSSDGPVLHVNAVPRADGSHEACTATVAYVLVQALSRRNVDLFPLAVAGAVADRQHLGGFKGLNAELASEAREHGLEAPPGLLAPTGESLLEVLSRHPDPFVPGLGGRARAAKSFLDELHLPADALAADVAGSDARRFASALTLHLLDRGAPATAVDAVVGPRFPVPVEGVEHAHELAELLTHAALAGRPGLGLAVLLEHDDGLAEARELTVEGRGRLLPGLLRLEREGFGGEHLAWFRRDEPDLLPLQADLAHATLAPRDPLLGVAQGDEGVRLEARRRRKRGAGSLDLRRLLHKVAPDDDARVGGHPASAWAVVPEGDADVLAARVDEVLGEVA